MKHLKTFKVSDNFADRELLLSDVACYLEEKQPINKEEGFIECVFDTQESFCFIFSMWTDDDIFDKFYNFLKSNKLKIVRELSYTQKWEIQVKLSEKKIKEYASLYNSTQKYNL